MDNYNNSPNQHFPFLPSLKKPQLTKQKNLTRKKTVT